MGKGNKEIEKINKEPEKGNNEVAKGNKEVAKGDRETGKSSKKKELLRTLKYALIAASAGAIQLLSTFLLNTFLLKGTDNYFWCYLIGLVLSVLWNFTLNRKYTFKSANNVPIAMLKVAAYYLVFTPLSTWWVDALVTAPFWGSLNASVVEAAVQVFTMLVNFVTEFLYQRFFVFGKSIDSRE